MPNRAKPFIPRDKPKSWVVFNSAGLSGLFVAAPLIVTGSALSLPWLSAVGYILFVSCALVGFLMWFVFVGGMLRGKYKSISEKSWRDQVW
jgi:tellurite resistance protein TehA-like permease